MKHYRLTQNAFIGGVFYKSGDTVPSDDEPGPHMIRVVIEGEEDAAVKKAAAAEKKAAEKAAAEAAKKSDEGTST